MRLPRQRIGLLARPGVHFYTLVRQVMEFAWETAGVVLLMDEPR
jgi:hypothetical protein